jgi:hypothetical protein
MSWKTIRVEGTPALARDKEAPQSSMLALCRPQRKRLLHLGHQLGKDGRLQEARFFGIYDR